jgi:hypothetical protein
MQHCCTNQRNNCQYVRTTKHRHHTNTLPTDKLSTFCPHSIHITHSRDLCTNAMIGKRANVNELCEAARWSYRCIQETAKQFGISISAMRILLIGYCIQQANRDVFTVRQLRQSCIGGAYAYELKHLKVLQYLEVTGHNSDNGELFNLTNAGEYVVRAFNTRLSRLVNDTKLSKARLTREKREKLKAFTRVANVKGTKLY